MSYQSIRFSKAITNLLFLDVAKVPWCMQQKNSSSHVFGADTGDVARRFSLAMKWQVLPE
jgi:hypothetical protein